MDDTGNYSPIPPPRKLPPLPTPPWALMLGARTPAPHTLPRRTRSRAAHAPAPHTLAPHAPRLGSLSPDACVPPPTLLRSLCATSSRTATQPPSHQPLRPH